jgi:hypothetical protein
MTARAARPKREEAVTGRAHKALLAVIQQMYWLDYTAGIDATRAPTSYFWLAKICTLGARWLGMGYFVGIKNDMSIWLYLWLSHSNINILHLCSHYGILRNSEQRGKQGLSLKINDQ